MVCNLNALIRPLLDRLAGGNLTPRQRNLVAAVNSSLEDITSPLSRRFLVEAARLTPTETRVANLIRHENPPRRSPRQWVWP